MFAKSLRLQVVLVLAVALAAGVVLVVVRGPARADVTVPSPTGHGTNVAVVPGDFTGDGKTDLAVTGSQYFSSVPAVASAGDGSFTGLPGTLSDTGWAGWSSVPGVRVLTGDFNGDHKTDMALVPPPGTPWWYTLPVAMSAGNGSFTVTNTTSVRDFTRLWAQTPGTQVVTGDFNGDGLTDIALVGGQFSGVPMAGIPIAYSQGDGSFDVEVAGFSNADFGGWDSVAGVRVLTGDFNGDHLTDIALVPPPGTGWWYTLPVAFASAWGPFTVTNVMPSSVSDFTNVWAQGQWVRPVTGDFNGDGKTDIALVGGQGWTSVPVAYSNGDGNFQVRTATLSNTAFGGWAAWAVSHVIVANHVAIGDFNGDGKTDIALPGVQTQQGVQTTFTIPVAFSDGTGSFTVTNSAIGTVPPDWGSFGYIAATDTVGWTLAGDYDGDGKADLALVTSNQSNGDGPAGVPMAFSRGDGTFTITVKQAPSLVSSLDGIPGDPNSFDLGTCAGLHFCQQADVDGDGTLDSVGFVPADTQYPALAGAVIVDASGSGWRVWGTGFCLQPQETCTVKNAEGSGLAADVVQFENSTPGRQGNVEVALSDPANHRFGAPAQWGQNLCNLQGETCDLAYVNGDFYPDVVDLTHAAARPYQGSVLVSLGSGHDFATPALWGTGICAQAAGFCTLGWAYTGPAGAHTPPSILQVTPDGTASVSFSNGISSFGTPQQWGTGLCVHATACQLLDMNGDGIGDVVYKDANDHSLSTSQLWLAYGQNTNSYAAPVIFDVNTLTTAAAVTGPRPADGITLTAYTGPASPAASNVTCGSAFVSANDHYWAAHYFNRVGWIVHDAVKAAALLLGESEHDASYAGAVAAAPFFDEEQDLISISNDSIQDFQNMSCPGTALGPDPFIWGVGD